MLFFKQFGVGVAPAILIDATIVRAVLLPASMKLLGDWTGTCTGGCSGFLGSSVASQWRRRSASRKRPRVTRHRPPAPAPEALGLRNRKMVSYDEVARSVALTRIDGDRSPDHGEFGAAR